MRRWALLALVAVGLAVGCLRVTPPLEAPVVDVLSATVAAPAEDGSVTVALELSLANPNREPLVLRAADWELAGERDGRAAARGRWQAEVSIPARGAATATVTARLGAGAAARLGGDDSLAFAATLHCFAARGAVVATVQARGLALSAPASAP